MSTYASELLDGFNESVAEFGTTINVIGPDRQHQQSTPVPVLAVGPELSVEMMMAGKQDRGTFNFQVVRTSAQSAGIGADTHFTVAGGTLVYHVLPIEDDPGSPLLYISAGEVE